MRCLSVASSHCGHINREAQGTRRAGVRVAFFVTFLATQESKEKRPCQFRAREFEQRRPKIPAYSSQIRPVDALSITRF